MRGLELNYACNLGNVDLYTGVAERLVFVRDSGMHNKISRSSASSRGIFREKDGTGHV